MTPLKRQRSRLGCRLVGGVAVAVCCAMPIMAEPQERGSSTPAQDPAVSEYESEPQGLVAEPLAVKRAVVFSDRQLGKGDLTNGPYVKSWSMIPGGGWISGGLGYRHWYSEDRVFLDASAAISLHGYKTAEARVELPRLARSRVLLGSQVRWQDLTQVPFFGEGPDALESNVSEYRLKSKELAGYATFRPAQWIDIDARIGWLKPSILPRAGFFLRDRPDTAEMLPGNIAYAISEQPSFTYTSAAISADTRDYPGHPTRGAFLRAAATHYSDRETNLFSFRQYEAEAERFVPLADSRVVIALHGWLIGSDTADGQSMPFYLQPGLGGHNSLRGYADYRFHDRNLLLVNAEARIAMMTHVDAAMFVDAGNVAPRLGDVNLAKRSYGAGLRLHSRRQTYARVDLARSDEGWRFMVRLSDPLNLARVSKRTAAVPFVP